MPQVIRFGVEDFGLRAELVGQHARVRLRRVAKDGDFAGPFERVDRGTAAQRVERALLLAGRDALLEFHHHFTGQVVEALRRRVDVSGGAVRRHHRHRLGRELAGEGRAGDDEGAGDQDRDAQTSATDMS